MHHYLINASLQVVPITTDKHPYNWVDDAIEVIRQSGVKYEVGPFATVLEANYDQIISVVNSVNEFLYEQNCQEWILNVQLQMRSNRGITASEKTKKFKQDN